MHPDITPTLRNNLYDNSYLNNRGGGDLVVDKWRQETIALDNRLQSEVGFVEPSRQLHNDQHALTLKQAVDLKHRNNALYIYSMESR